LPQSKKAEDESEEEKEINFEARAKGIVLL
jgi:hypothetical protein